MKNLSLKILFAVGLLLILPSISEAKPTIWNPPTDPDYSTEDQLYEAKFNVSDYLKNVPITVKLKNSPPGMTLSPTTLDDGNKSRCSFTRRGWYCTWRVTIRWTPDNDAVKNNYDPQNERGSWKVSFTVENDDGDSDSYSYTLYVQNVNDPPVLDPIPNQTVDEDSTFSYTAKATDIDPTNDKLTYTLDTAPDGMTINAVTGKITWTPRNKDVGTHSVTVRVEDGRGGIDRETFTIVVINTNDPPKITSTPPRGAIAGGLYTYTLKAIDIDPTNDTLSYSLTQSPPGMTIRRVDNNTALIEWNVPRWAAGRTFTVEAQVDDGKGGTDKQTWTIKVYRSNNKPIFLWDPNTCRNDSPPSSNATEDQQYSALIGTCDKDGDTVTFSFILAPKGMKLTPQTSSDPKISTALITWIPTNEQVGNHIVYIQADDGRGGVITYQYTITVANTNDPPVITSSPITVAVEDQQYVYQVVAVDPDPTNDKITYKLVNAPTGMTIDSTQGVIKWTPTNKEANQSYTVIVRAEDNNGASTSQTYTLKVLNTNDPPVITSNPPTTTAVEDSPFKYIVTATDPDPTNDKLTYRLVIGPQNATIDSKTGLLQWTPNNDDAIEKTHPFLIEVSDDKGGKTTQSFTITVKNTNDPPIITSSPVTKAVAFQKYTYDVDAKDPDPTNDTITYKLIRAPQGMTIEQLTGIISWLPKLADVGKHTVIVEAKDNHGASTQQKFTIDVIDKNNAPEITSKPITSATEDQKYVYQVKAKDKDGDKLTYILELAPVDMKIDKNNGIITWTPSNSDVGTHDVRFRVEDGKGGVARQSYKLTVKNVNDPPKIISQPVLTATEDKLYTYSVKAKDIDPTNDKLTFKLLKAPAGMKIDSSLGTITWTPVNKDVGQHIVTIEVSDGKGGKDIQTYTLMVKNVNDPPVFTFKPPSSIKEDVPFSFTLTAKDPDPTNDTLRYTLLKGPKGMKLDPNSGLLQWTPTNSDVGKHTVRAKVEDGKGGSAIKEFTLVVVNVNDPPKIVSTPIKGATQGKKYIYKVRAVDIDPTNDKLTYKLLKFPQGMVINSNTGEISWTPTNSDVGKQHVVIVEVSDGKGGKDSQSWTIEVFNVNDPPTFTVKPKNQKAKQGQIFTYQMRASDPDKDPIKFTLVKAPKGMKINPSTGLIEWVPTNDDVGSHVITVQIEDGKGGTDTITFGVDVDNVNDPPRIISTPVTEATEDQTYIYKVEAEDIDPTRDKLSFSLEAAPKGMVIDKTTGIIRWVPTNADAEKVHAVSVKVEDGNGGKDIQSFNIQVKNVNDPPEFISKPITEATEDQSYIYLVKARDIDPTKDKLTFSLKVDTKTSGLTIDPSTGLVQWVPTNDDAIVGKFSITITVDDGNGGTAEQKFIITVKNTNDPPKITSQPIEKIMMDQLYTYNVKAVDEDPTRDKLVFSLTQKPDGMTIDKDTGVIQWKPTNLDVGEHDVTIKVEDGNGGEDTQSYKLIVLVDPEAPIAAIVPLPIVHPDQITLDGTLSRDPKNQKLTFDWSLVKGPVQQVKIDKPSDAKPKVILRKAGVYEFRLVVENEKGKKSKPAFMNIIVKDVPPVAHIAGGNVLFDFGEDYNRAWKAVAINQKVTLDGSASDDSNGDVDKLKFEWKQTGGAGVSIQDADKAKAYFTPKQPGLYTFQLKVTDTAGNESEPTFINIIAFDPTKPETHPPYAEIRAPKEIKVEEEVELDGSRSRSFSGKDLKYNWKVVEGPDTKVIQKETEAKAVFKAFKPGSYLIQLVVVDSIGPSLPAYHRITVHPKDLKLPIADAKSGYAVFETLYTLDGTASQSSDGSQLLFEWTQVGGPPVVLRKRDTAQPSFFVLNKGTYRFKLVVKQKEFYSPPVFSIIRVNEDENNKPPQPDAGKTPDKHIQAGKKFQLNGKLSSDPENQPLKFFWRQIGGIPVILGKGDTPTPEFIPVAYGILTFELIVSDGKVLSLPGTIVKVVVFDKDNHPPIADAGEDQKVLAGVNVQLDGSKSSDPDGDKLIYSWRLISPSPEEAGIKLDDPSKEKPSFNIPEDTKVNEFIFGLIVDDGKISSLEDTVSVKVEGVNEAPVAKVKAPTTAYVGEKVILDGSKSSDPNPTDKLVFKWEQTGGSKVVIKDAKKPKAYFIAQEPGFVRVKLTVSDGTLESTAIAIVEIKAKEEAATSGCGCSSSPQNQPLSILLLFLLLPIFIYRRKKNLFTSIN